MGIKDLPQTIWWEDSALMMIDQSLLPQKYEIITLKTVEAVAEAITVMRVRGAPAIGATAAYGLAVAAITSKAKTPENLIKDLGLAKERLARTRPTAYNLFWALDQVMSVAQGPDVESIKENILDKAHQIRELDIETNRQIGVHGATLIRDGMNIETHCNAGSLASVYYGTALAPFYIAQEEGKKFHVWVDETRPRLQGARLTIWELQKAGVDCTLITDNMAGHLMRNGLVDLVIVGADRVSGKTGDVANKIGTYMLSLAAHDNNVPFYVAAPVSTIDFEVEAGMAIKIEERSTDEVLFIRGQRISPAKKAKNFAFDVTPAKYIAGIITEKGIVPPSKLMSLRR
ncbi:MAG: S-methyl-5-thioribose-1-phosphate isomerase [Candidatus Hodarchaeota archaeon]